jgi:ABC-type multidrug transport system ATPase subunit
LLILDEPAALDPIGRRDVLEVMSKLRKCTTGFYSTHFLDDVQRVSDTVAILNKGELVAEGPIEELLAGSEGVVNGPVLVTEFRRKQYELEDVFLQVVEGGQHGGK